MKAIGDCLFELDRTGTPAPRLALQRVNAKSLGLQESWFRDAIFANPELVIAPCRAAGQVDQDEVWLPWRIEENFGSGPIDVLLVSSRGRIGIVETKLSYNPQKRREVVAQVMDYALSLQGADREDLPDLPDSPEAPLEEALSECLSTGRFLLVIAGDALDPRALRLSQSMLARHLTSEWDLAMVDLNVYHRPAGDGALILVPELLGTVQADLRQVVRVMVQGESPKARIVVDKIVHDDGVPSRGPVLTSIDDFLLQVKKQVPGQVEVGRAVVELMQRMAGRSNGTLVFGLKGASANLYCACPVGGRRFLSLRTDGRLRIVLAYLRTAGLDDIIDKLVGAAAPTILMSRQDRAGGVRYLPAHKEEILMLLERIERALSSKS